MKEKTSTENKRTFSTAIIGGAIIIVLLILTTLWISRSGKSGTNEAVQSVSSIYLRELTDRREQGIVSRIKDNVDNIKTALRILSPNDLQSVENLSAFLGRMKMIYGVDQFAFVDADGRIITPQGVVPKSEEYFFVGEIIAEPKIFTYNLSAKNKSAAIAVPVGGVTFQGVPIKTCFLQADIKHLLKEILLQTTTSGITFFNLYYKNGDSLTNSALGSLNSDTNILDALNGADFEEGYSREQVQFDFENSRVGMVVFTFDGDKKNALLSPRGKYRLDAVLSDSRK